MTRTGGLVVKGTSDVSLPESSCRLLAVFPRPSVLLVLGSSVPILPQDLLGIMVVPGISCL